MLEQDAIALVHRWFVDLWQEQRYEVLAEVLNDPFMRHSSTGSGEITLAEYLC